MDAYAYFYGANQYFANKGYVVLSVNYRSGIGYGLNFREALNYGASGGSENLDVLGAGVYMAGRADVDPKRIALWRIVWWIVDRAGAGARERSVRGGRGHDGRA